MSKMKTIQFGTDGWRAIIADDFTVSNLSRVTVATAEYAVAEGFSKIVVGHDNRFGGPLFTRTVARILAYYQLNVVVTDRFITTPILSYSVTKHEADLGIMITASHNPSEYNGFKIKDQKGRPLGQLETEKIQNAIPNKVETSTLPYEMYVKQELVKEHNLEEDYYQYIVSKVDLQALFDANIRCVYDGMFGAGQGIFMKIIPYAIRLHCDDNPSYNGVAPEPIEKNLGLMAQIIQNTPYTHCGIANDGDGDRIGVCDNTGKYLDSQHLLLLLVYYLAHYKGEKGKVITTFSVTDKVRKLTNHFDLELVVTKIGFKYIAEHLDHKDLLVAGEESGGFALKDHILDRDGVWTGITLLNCVKETGKQLSVLLEEVEAITGKFAYKRKDIKVSKAELETILDTIQSNKVERIGKDKVIREEDLDGKKYYLSENRWVMIRPSGTEPMVRVYAHGEDDVDAKKILSQTNKALRSF